MYERISTRDYQADPQTREANSRRYNSSRHVDNCFLCGRGLTESAVDNGWSVHLSTSGEFIHKDDNVTDTQDSQGWFPVGPECAKKIPSTHKSR